MRILPRLFQCLFVIVAAFSGNLTYAADPLGLTPGVAGTKVLGQIQTIASFNTSTATADISYSNADLATRTYVVRLPSGYDENNPAKKYGLVTYIDAADAHSFPSSYAAALDAHDVIWIGGNGIGNPQSVSLRRGVAIMGAYRIRELYPAIDPARIYGSGLSGGSRTANDLTYLRSDFFRGFIGRVGSSLPAIIPNWECAGTDSTNADADYEYMSVNAADPAVVLPPYFRSALMTQYGDFRRAEQMAVYRYGHLNHGNTSRIVIRNGGHSDEVGPSFTDALNLMYHPFTDVIWDRFENAKLAANTQVGKTVAGTGFTTLSGSVSETAYTYNSATHGVLKLTGDGAAAKSNDAFTWQNSYGILLDARLRSENAITAGQNQQIGLHIVPDSFTGAASDQPGFHLYWCYGQPYRAEIVSAAGVRKILATWEHATTHPMSLAATDKTFWGDIAAPDYAGRTKSFRGEDVRLVLNSTGFQLTFNRPANNVSSTYAGVVSLFNDSSTPYAEHLPVVLQGMWSEVETALVNALPSGNWRLALTNDAVVTGQPVGNALIDELRVVGSSGLQAAPPLTVTAPANTTRTLSWTRIHGAMGYVIERSSSPDGPFTSLVTLSNTAATHSDTVPQNIAYYYRIAAVGSDGIPGNGSIVAFAARNVPPPAAPSSPGVTYPVSQQVNLTWVDNANNETAYRIERSPAGLEQWTLVTGSLAAGTTAYTDAAVIAGNSYDYRISAVGTGGVSSYASLTANVPDAAPPAPGGLAAIATYGSVDLSWNAVAQAATYQVRRADSSGGLYAIIASGSTSPTFSDTTFTPGVTYYYVVKAVSGSGLLVSANSAEIAVPTLELLAPALLSVIPGFTSNLLLWPASTGATAYTVRRSAISGSGHAVIATGITGTSYLDTGLSTGTPYYYYVTATIGSIVSAASLEASGTPVPGIATKANNTTALDQATSWSTGVVPSAVDKALWNGTYSTGSIGIGSGLAVEQLQFASPSQAITINAGSGPLALGAGGIEMGTATQNLTVLAPVTLTSGQTWSIAAGRTLTVNGGVGEDLQGRSIQFDGNGTLVLSGSNTFSGPMILAPPAGGLPAYKYGGNNPSAYLRLTGGSHPAPVTVQGRLDVAGGLSSLGTLSGNSGIGHIHHSSTVENGFTFSGGSSFSMFQIGADNARGILRQSGVGTVSFTYFGYNRSTPGASHTFDGGTWSINQIGQNNTGAQTSGTCLITNGANVSVSNGSYAHGTWNISHGRLGFGGPVSEGNGSPNANETSLIFNVNNSGGGPGLLEIAGNLTLADGGSATNSNSLTIGNGGTVRILPSGQLTLGSVTARTAETDTVTLQSGGKLILNGTLAAAAATTGQTRVFEWTGGQLTATTLTPGGGFTAPSSGSGLTTIALAQLAGTLAPGDLGTAGRTAINGSYQLGASGILNIDLGGITQATAFQTGQYDYLTVSGTTTLAGNLTVKLIGGFTPANATTFTVLNSTGTLSGAFENVAFGSRITTAGAEGTFLVTQSGNTVRLSDYKAALTPLQSWRQLYFGTTANSGTAADTFDADFDGLQNLLEYALGTIPTSPASAAPPSLATAANRLTLTFNRIADPALVYQVEAGPDLSTASWSTIWQSTGAQNTAGPITVTDTDHDITTATPPRRFLRLRVNSP